MPSGKDQKPARHVGFPKADKVQKGSHHLATFNMSDPTLKSLNKNKKIQATRPDKIKFRRACQPGK